MKKTTNAPDVVVDDDNPSIGGSKQNTSQLGTKRLF